MICKPIQIKFLFSECTIFDKHRTKNLMQIALVILEKFPFKVTYQKQMKHSTHENQRYYIFVEWKMAALLLKSIKSWWLQKVTKHYLREQFIAGLKHLNLENKVLKMRLVLDVLAKLSLQQQLERLKTLLVRIII